MIGTEMGGIMHLLPDPFEKHWRTGKFSICPRFFLLKPARIRLVSISAVQQWYRPPRSPATVEAIMLKPSAMGPALITGCSSGVGYATALAFRAAGLETFATARNSAQLGELRAAGCQILTLDVTDEAARRAAVEVVEKQFGAVGILVNNAGYGQYGPVEEISLDDMRRQFETNVFGSLRLSQLVLPAMRRAGRGRIVNVSSVAGRVSALGGGAYHASKFAVEALADALRPEVEPFGIDVVNVLPGPISTRFEAALLKSIPDTGMQGPYYLFKKSLAHRMHEFLKPGAFGVMTAETVAAIILKAATVKRPRTRYSVGFIARFGPLGRVLAPDRLVDFVTRRSIQNTQANGIDS